MTPRNRILAAWAPAVAYMALIWGLSSMPNPPVTFEDVPFQDKGAHAAEYAGLAALLLHAFLGTFVTVRPKVLLASAMLGATLWGLLDEIHQAFVPGRASDVHDVMADAVGAVVGSTLYFLAARAVRSLRS